MGWCPPLDTSHDLRLGLAKFPRLFEAWDAEAGLGLCLPATIDHHQITTFRERHVCDQPAHQLLALGVRGSGSIPERWEILSQRAALFPLLGRQPQRSRYWLGLLVPFQPIHFHEFLVPVSFQAARHQSILWVSRMVAAARQVCLVLRPFDLPLRLLIQLFGASLQMGESRERDFQLCRLHGFQQRLADDLVNAIPSQGRADFDRQWGMRLATFVDHH